MINCLRSRITNKDALIAMRELEIRNLKKTMIAWRELEVNSLKEERAVLVQDLRKLEFIRDVQRGTVDIWSFKVDQPDVALTGGDATLKARFITHNNERHYFNFETNLELSKFLGEVG